MPLHRSTRRQHHREASVGKEARLHLSKYVVRVQRDGKRPRPHQEPARLDPTAGICKRLGTIFNSARVSNGEYSVSSMIQRYIHYEAVAQHRRACCALRMDLRLQRSRAQRRTARRMSDRPRYSETPVKPAPAERAPKMSADRTPPEKITIAWRLSLTRARYAAMKSQSASPLAAPEIEKHLDRCRGRGRAARRAHARRVLRPAMAKGESRSAKTICWTATTPSRS